MVSGKIKQSRPFPTLKERRAPSVKTSLKCTLHLDSPKGFPLSHFGVLWTLDATHRVCRYDKFPPNSFIPPPMTMMMPSLAWIPNLIAIHACHMDITWFSPLLSIFFIPQELAWPITNFALTIATAPLSPLVASAQLKTGKYSMWALVYVWVCVCQRERAKV